ncbi:MAG TPA: glycosyltransferase, partial [Gemmatimonadales bacterium]|nr:glycosyltransferase [Gemmatimonadales bacterium]
MTRPIDVSVLVPAKDEAENLPEFVRLSAEALHAAPFSFELVVVDDGSRDESAAVLRLLQTEHPFLRVVTHRRQRGIAEALRSASEAARGDVYVFYPA